MLNNHEKIETTFERFIGNDPVEKEKFDKEYSEFLFSEFILETMESDHCANTGKEGRCLTYGHSEDPE